MTSFTKRVPAELVLNLPVEVLCRVALTDLMASALTMPPSKLTRCVAAELVEAMPPPVASDAARVSTVPVESAFGTPTDATMFEWTTPVVEVQPSTTSAERPDFTVLPTRS